MSSAPIFDPRRALLRQSVGQLSDDELECVADEDEVAPRALAELRATTLAEVRAKGAPLADRELETCIAFGKLALILFILADLTR